MLPAAFAAYVDGREEIGPGVDDILGRGATGRFGSAHHGMGGNGDGDGLVDGRRFGGANWHGNK